MAKFISNNRASAQILHHTRGLCHNILMTSETLSLQPHNISTELIPTDVANYFSFRSRKLTDAPPLPIADFDDLMIFNFGDAGNVYAAAHTKSYRTDTVERLVYLADTDATGNLQGSGEVRLTVTDQSDYFRDKPFVGFTRTRRGYRELGLGMRRLHVMNAVTNNLFNLPLYSDTSVAPKAQRLWHRLVEQGVAEEYMEGQGRRFQFLGITALI